MPKRQTCKYCSSEGNIVRSKVLYRVSQVHLGMNSERNCFVMSHESAVLMVSKPVLCMLRHSLKLYEIKKKVNFRVLLGAITTVSFCFQHVQTFPKSCRKSK